MRISRLALILCLFCVSPVLAQEPRQFVPAEPTLPQFDEPQILIPKGSGDYAYKFDHKEFKKLMKRLNKEEKEFHTAFKKYKSLYPPMPTEKSEFISGLSHEKMEPFFDFRRQECKELEKETQYSDYTCHMDTFKVFARWNDYKGPRNSAREKSYAAEVELYVPTEDFESTTINGGWISDAGDKITIIADPKAKSEHLEIMKDYINLRLRYKELDSLYDNINTMLEIDQSQKKSWLGRTFGKKPSITLEEFQERQNKFEETHDAFEDYHKAQLRFFDLHLNSGDFFNESVRAHPQAVLDRMKTQPHAVSIQVGHSFQDCNIRYNEAWFDGYHLVAKANIAENNVSCFINNHSDLYDWAREELKESGADIYLVCEGMYTMRLASNDGFKIPKAQTTWCGLLTPYFKQSRFYHINSGKEIRYVDISPYIGTSYLFTLYKRDGTFDFMTLSAAGAHQDDLP